MKKKIIILGSTGSVGTNTLKVIEKDKKNFDVLILSANQNVDKLLKQAKTFNCKNIIITDKEKFFKIKKKKLKVNIFNNFEVINKIINTKKVFYSMISISGLEGLKPSLILAKYSKNLAIVNKEALISGWSLISRNINRYKVNFIPIDSEHYCIFELLKNYSKNNIEKIYITASGGPFLNFPNKYFHKITPSMALKHPNWKMGKKITIDSATMMNKVFEIIEAKNIFDFDYKNISILTHPSSYVHAIIKFKNGLIKLVAHDTDMKIPIFNSLYKNKKYFFKTDNLNIDKFNNLNLKTANLKKFPVFNLLKNLPNFNSLYETVLITINDFLVDKFLKNEINFKDLNNLIVKLALLKDFNKFKKIKADNIDKIYEVEKYVSFKIRSLSI